jgi:hypothetical protein
MDGVAGGLQGHHSVGLKQLVEIIKSADVYVVY